MYELPAAHGSKCTTDGAQRNILGSSAIGIAREFGTTVDALKGSKPSWVKKPRFLLLLEFAAKYEAEECWIVALIVA